MGDNGGNEVSRIEIGNAFLRELSFSDFDATVSTVGDIRLVAVPSTLRGVAPGRLPPVSSAGKRFYSYMFDITVGSVDTRRISAVRGIRMTIDKLPVESSALRRQFAPGAVHFDSIRLEGTDTALVDLQSRVNQVTAGTLTYQPGTLRALDLSRSDVGEIEFTNLLPIAIEPFPTAGTRRGVTLSVGQFTLR